MFYSSSLTELRCLSPKPIFLGVWITVKARECKQGSWALPSWTNSCWVLHKPTHKELLGMGCNSVVQDLSSAHWVLRSIPGIEGKERERVGALELGKDFNKKKEI